MPSDPVLNFSKAELLILNDDNCLYLADNECKTCGKISKTIFGVVLHVSGSVLK